MFSISLHNEWIEKLEDYYSTEGISDPDFPELDLSMALYSGLTFALAAAIFFGLVW